MTKIHTKVVIDIASGKVLEDEWFEHEGNIAECKGGGSSSSKPLNLDDYLGNSLYPELQKQYNFLSTNYPADKAFTNWMGESNSQIGTMKDTLGGAQKTLGDLSGLTSNLMTSDSFSKAMQPYLNKAYQGIGYSGMPGGSYVDKNLAEATQQGWMSNLGNILSALQSQQAQTGQISDLTQGLNTLTGQQYSAVTEPLDFIKSIQQGRYNQSTSKSSQESTGFLWGLFG
jgi:hypothetical protein